MDEQERAHAVRAAEDVVAALPDTPEGAVAISPHWFHESRLGDGSVVPGSKTLALLSTEKEVVFGPLDLAGRSVLDVGAWNGAFTFEAERRGAASVTASDRFTWMNPVWRGLETLLFVKRSLGSEAKVVVLDAEENTLERVGPFDVVLLLGVFYHLPDPLICIKQLSEVVQHCLVIETHCDCLDDPLPAMRYYPGSELNGDHTNWWGPNPACMVGILQNAGFARVVATESPIARGRYFFHAFKD